MVLFVGVLKYYPFDWDFVRFGPLGNRPYTQVMEPQDEERVRAVEDALITINHNSTEARKWHEKMEPKIEKFETWMNNLEGQMTWVIRLLATALIMYGVSLLTGR